MKSRTFSITTPAMVLALCALAASSSWHATNTFHASTPAGYDVLLLKPNGSILTLLGLIECPELEGVQQVADGMKSKIIGADGKPLVHFPRHFDFRITASLRKTVLVEPTEVFNIPEKPQDLLLNLRFRLKTYHALKVQEIQPQSVQMIGVPAEVSYDERVYRVSFAVDDIPITDRCVLEILAPSGERLTKFHFDLL